MTIYHVALSIAYYYGFKSKKVLNPQPPTSLDGKQTCHFLLMLDVRISTMDDSPLFLAYVRNCPSLGTDHHRTPQPLGTRMLEDRQYYKLNNALRNIFGNREQKYA